MPYSDILHEEIRPEAILQAGNRPRLESFDSAQEFSIERLRELRKLVEAEDQELNGFVFDDSCLRVA